MKSLETKKIKARETYKIKNSVKTSKCKVCGIDFPHSKKRICDKCRENKEEIPPLEEKIENLKI